MLRGPDGLISKSDAGLVPSYQLFNPHGDTSAVTGVLGEMTSSYRYNAFGDIIAKAAYITDPITGQKIESPVEPDDPVYGYTGKWQRPRDFSTSTIQMGVRDYDPGLGRFMSEDPLRGDPFEPLQRNRYPYVGSNPGIGFDLNGEFLDELNAAYQKTKDWLLGTGEGGSSKDPIEYGPETIETQDMMDSPGVDKARDKFYQENASKKCGEAYDKSVLRGDDNRFWPWDHFFRAGNPYEVFVGGYDIIIIPNDDGETITIKISNRTSINSFLYHVTPDAWNYDKGLFIPLNPSYGIYFQPGRNTYQEYYWTEPVRGC